MLEEYRKPNGELPFEGLIKKLKAKTEQTLESRTTNLFNNSTIYNGVPNNLETYDTHNRINWVSTCDISNYEQYDVDETIFREEMEDSDMTEMSSFDTYNNIMNVEITEESFPEMIYPGSTLPYGAPIYNNTNPMMFVGNDQVQIPNIPVIQQPHGHPKTNKMPSGYMDVEEVRRLAPPDSIYYKNDDEEYEKELAREKELGIERWYFDGTVIGDDSYQTPIYANKELQMHSTSFAAKERMMGAQQQTQQNIMQQSPFATPVQQQQPYNPYNNPNYNYIFSRAQTPFNPYNVSMPNNYIFAPAMPYPQNPYYQQPKVDYYNPFPEYNNRQQLLYYGYNNSYNPYYRPFMSVQMREQIMQQHTAMGKLRYKIACAGAGVEYKEATADEIFNPMNKINQMTDDDRVEANHWNFIMKVQYYLNNPNQFCVSEPQLTSLYIQTYFKNYHDMFDNHSLCEFFEEDYPRLMREFWIEENVKRTGRDLNSTYSSDSYKELLNLHRSTNPYINHLLNDFNHDKYDNNSGDQDVGVLEMLQYGARKDYQSSHPIMKPDGIIQNPEIKKMKSQFIDTIMEQMNSKYNSGAARLQRNLVEKTRIDKPVNQATNQAISLMLEQSSSGVIDSGIP